MIFYVGLLGGLLLGGADGARLGNGLKATDGLLIGKDVLGLLLGDELGTALGFDDDNTVGAKDWDGIALGLVVGIAEGLAEAVVVGEKLLEIMGALDGSLLTEGSIVGEVVE